MKQELTQSLTTAVAALYDVEINVELSRPDEKFGDFATNVALQLAGKSELQGRPPRQIAEELATELRQNYASDISNVAVAGPGFLNIMLTDQALQKAAAAELPPTLTEQTILTEFSDPNPFKPLHAGHLYTTLVGDTISRLLENAGAHVVRINYGGDVGLHVGKSMWAILTCLGGENPEKLADISENDRPTWLGIRYVEGNNAYEDDSAGDHEATKAEIVETNRRVYAIHANNDHESAFAQIYWTCRQWSYDYFHILYGQLQVKSFDRYVPESEVTPLGLRTVKEQTDKGVYCLSDGATVYKGEQDGLHTRVFINSAGLPTYETKDVGLILTKWHDYHFDTSIIITANEQTQYFQVMLASVSKFEPEPAKRTRHIPHGTVKLQGGVKMSSRRGNTVTALEILEAARRAAAELNQGPDGSSEDTVLAAVKYAFAKNRIGGDIAYDPRESIALEGNSGPYLQYAHARARSILAKVSAAAAEVLNATELEPDERSLLRKLGEYPEVIERATLELMPHYICTYLYELAQAFNRFYEKNRVIDDPRQDVRLALIMRYADRLKSGLELLGITAPDRM